MSLQKLIAPLTTEIFLSEYFERRHLHVRRDDSGYFGDLLDDGDLEQQIWRYSSQWGDLSLARANTRPSDNMYALERPTVDTIAAAFADGYTVVVNNYQQKNPCVAAFCRQVEKFFCFRCNVNLYLTGPQCKGLDAHYDDQDVFVMQVEGMKVWRIFEGGPLLPLEDQPYQCPDVAQLPFVEVVLRPGDVLYLPRGFIHDARTENCYSKHLTLSVSVVRQAALLRQLIGRVASREVWLRRAIPLANLRGEVSSDRTMLGMANVLESITTVDLQRTLSDLQDRLLQASLRLPGKQLWPFKTRALVTIESTVKLADDQICILSEVGTGHALKFIGGQLPLSADMLEAAQFVCRRECFRIGDISEELSNGTKVAFVQFLMDHGLLVLVED